MTNDPTTANTLGDARRRRLAALADTILPASADGRMPSAADLDLVAYLDEQAGGFMTRLPAILDAFDDRFADQPLAARVALVETFAKDSPALFEDLLLRVYDCYYQNDRVRALIGAQPGPPFPRGNVIPAGDLSALDAVAKRAKTYRR